MDLAGSVQMFVGVVNVVAIVGGALYLHGKLEGKSEATSSSSEKGSATAQSALLLATALDAQVEAHLDECNRREAALDRRFLEVKTSMAAMRQHLDDRIGELEKTMSNRFDNVQGQINTLARGEAGIAYEIMPGTRKRAPPR